MALEAQESKQTCKNKCIFYNKISTHDPDKGMICSLGNRLKCNTDRDPCWDYTMLQEMTDEV